MDRIILPSKPLFNWDDVVVYHIKNKITGKIYIGVTRSYWKREKEHRDNLRLNIHSNKTLQLDYNLQGLIAFEFIPMYWERFTTKKRMSELENDYILKCVPLVYNVYKINPNRRKKYVFRESTGSAQNPAQLQD